MPEYAPVSRAIKASGAKLLLYLDASGLWNPWSDGKDWFRAYWIFNTRTHGRLWGPTRFLLGALRQSIPATLAKPRLEHMALADVIGTGSPGALARTKRYAETFGFGHITDRMVLSPPPIPVHFRYESEEKKKRVICVARWLKLDRAQKNPAMLLASLVLFLNRRPDYEAVVVGRGANDLRRTKFYPAELKGLSVRFIEAIPNTELTTLYKESRISFCSSYHESVAVRYDSMLTILDSRSLRGFAPLVVVSIRMVSRRLVWFLCFRLPSLQMPRSRSCRSISRCRPSESSQKPQGSC
jgi:glycosyltransferase involved in cell wall biosynthesis